MIDADDRQVRTDPAALAALNGRRVNAYAFGEDGAPSSRQWRRTIDDRLARVATEVYASIAFQPGLIGFEASGYTYTKDFHVGRTPSPGIGYLVPHASGLRFLAATR